MTGGGAGWFAYSVLAILGWGGWAICSKLGSLEIPVNAMLFLYAWGALPVLLALLATRHFRLERNLKGALAGIANGFIGNIGNLALLAAYRTGGNTSVITVATSLYPVITVLLAVVILRERFSRRQAAGLALALAALVIFAL